MSLVCGACEHTIFESFGMIYRLEKETDGTIRVPDDDYCPGNSAICGKCWNTIPDGKKVANRKDLDANNFYYGFAIADSGRTSGLFGSAKQWSSIDADTVGIWLHPSTIEQHCPKIVEIIDCDHASKKQFEAQQKTPTDSEFLTAVLDAVKQRDIQITNAHEYGLGLLATVDDKGDVDICFDPKRWTVNKPKEVEATVVSDTIHVLSGKRVHPVVKSIDHVDNFLMWNAHGKGDNDWFRCPPIHVHGKSAEQPAAN